MMTIKTRGALIVALCASMLCSACAVYAQGLCADRDGTIRSRHPVVGCGIGIGGGGRPYFTSQGFELYGYSSSGRDSPLPPLATGLRIRANQNSSITGGATVYSSLSIEAGATLNVPSGTVIRVRRGDCTIAGTIVVLAASRGGQRPDTLSGFSSDVSFAAAHPGLSNRAAGFGAIGQSVEAIGGGPGGIGLGADQAAQNRYPGLFGGGGGAAGSSEIGGAGGGSFVLLCESRIRVDGAVYADGIPALGPGGGGGAGGVIVLGSDDRIVLGANSVVRARGGDGGPATSNSAPGGGGGGGIIHLISTSIRRNGTTNVAGGAGQPAGDDTLENVLRSGGGGGGACGGDGGAGGGIGEDLSHTASGSGAPGSLIETVAVPRYIFG